MIYKSLKHCVDDLEINGHLIKIDQTVDPCLEMAEIQRRVYLNKGPALYFARVSGSPFPAVSNLFGTLDRSRFIFRSTLLRVKSLIAMKADAVAVLKAPWKHMALPLTGLSALPRPCFNGPVLAHSTSIDQLPQITSWPDEGGAFILLPQVYSESPEKPGIMRSNLGMYRIQLGGNQYAPNREIGLHYQIRRDIGIHHSQAMAMGKPLKVSIFVGGPPAHTFSAVMPLPEGLPEVAFAGALGGRAFRYIRKNGHVISADADFCITGTLSSQETRTEGPFGDHLGYYSLKHEFPFLKVDRVYHRTDAIWPFTAVGRPPQEDTSFGQLIHEITDPMVPVSLPGVSALHAVDAAGVHPLLLAVGSERYAPYEKRRPMELLTQANAILGFGHCALAKYLIIMAGEDRPHMDIHDIDAFFRHVLERIDLSRDLHFQTRTTMDTLDYSGTGINQGSKVVITAAGDKIRDLSTRIPSGLVLPPGFKHPALALPGVLMVEAPPFEHEENALNDIQRLEKALAGTDLSGLPWVVLTEDSAFAARTLNNFLWVTFTRSNPSHDIHGAGSFYQNKHWGCAGPMIIDARLKPHHAPPLIEDPKVTRRVDELGKKGGCLHGII
ncbi:MAG: UbiD family decarboxylase [Proteobacteria bacterium]|nr:UbiD family decarboxylase [Pseudomonadota bacterium]